MKKSTAILASLIAIAGITRGATLTAHAHPSRLSQHMAAPHTGGGSFALQHTLLQMPNPVTTIRPNDGGAANH